MFTGTITRNIYSLKDRSIIIICSATLTSTPTVACPDDTVAFTCTLPGTMGVTIGWTVTPPTGLNVASASGAVSNSFVMNIIGSDGFLFRADYSGFNGGMVTSILTTLTMVTALAGAMVDCRVIGGVGEDQVPISVAGE